MPPIMDQLPQQALLCQPYALCLGMEQAEDILSCRPVGLPHVAEKGIKTGTGCFLGAADNAGIQSKEECDRYVVKYFM